MQWLFDIVEEMMEKAGFIKIGDVELYLKGMIVIWSGDQTDVPDGWAICDGTQGTPNLTFRFVLGYAGPGTAHFTGGEVAHDHTFTGDGHGHGLRPGSGVQVGDGFLAATTSDPAVGTTDISSTFPPFYVLAYIMKL